MTKPSRPVPRLWLWNVLLAALLSLRFIDRVEPVGTKATLFLYLTLFTGSFVLSLIPALAGLPLAFLPTKARRPLIALVWTLFQGAIWLDATIWGIFHYHFNGLVWATISNPAAADSVHIGTTEIALNLAGLVVLFALQWRALKHLEQRPTFTPRLSNKLALLAILLPLTLVEKGIYAHADLIRDRRVTAIAGAFPLYQRLTIKRLMVKHFDYDLAARPQLDLNAGHFLLDYPRTAPTFAPTETPRPNIAIFVIDSLRRDAFTSESMPQITALAAQRGARIFDNHKSGGNATRFGIFSLIYGLHGSYWIPVLTEEASPVLLDSLADLDYKLGVFSTASMNYPEFRSTAWVKLPDQVHDNLPGETPAERDRAQIPAITTWLDGQPQAAPFFLFSLIDAPHQSYSFDEASAPFKPFAARVNYTSLASGTDEAGRQQLINSYKNAVHHADQTVATILADLDARGQLDNTIVVITGDHGEEFWEHGFFGHTSNFTNAQTDVPFLMLGPGIPAGHETLPTTHIDLVPTLLEHLGADPATRAEYTLGHNLLSPPGPDRRRIIAGWNLLGLDTPAGILVVPTSTDRGLIESWTPTWKPIIDDTPLIKSEAAALGRLALETGRFLR